MKKLALIAILAGTVMAVPANAAATISFTQGGSAPAAGTTVFQDFEALADGTNIGSNAFIFSNSISGVAAQPEGSTGKFAAVLGGGSYGVTFGPTSIFSFVLGSLDSYNSLSLKFADNTSQIFSGGEITNNGGVSGVVTYNAGTGSKITGATFTSSQNSFEFDNLAAAGAVPEASTWAMMIFGMGGIGGLMRRRQRAVVRFA